MKKIIGIAVCMAVLLLRQAGYTQSHFRDRAGVSFRGSYWHQRKSDVMMHVSSEDLFDNEVNVGGMGGWMTFFSGTGDNGIIVFSLGGIAHVDVEENGLFNEQVDVQVVSPILIGYQHILFGDRNNSAFQPYISAGGGPYILTRVFTVNKSFLDEEVTVKNKVKPGAFLGCGTYFIVSNWFAIHGEMRYHFVNFNPQNNESGFEMGLGLTFSWTR
ncbi:hypothetical protein JW948_11785 [bacterium]|nr:hypothetical protein [bacterium]